MSGIRSREPTRFMVVATTRPETMLGDTAVAVHSQDSRWNWAIGKSVELPLTGRKIPIIADDILVDPKFGSGVVKVTPAHDPNDYAVWQRHQGKADQIEIINILNPDGTINENGGKYAGMKREAARKKVVEDLTALGLLAKEEPYETQVGHSDRSKTPVEPYLSDQWFVKMAPLAEPALEVVRDGNDQVFPGAACAAIFELARRETRLADLAAALVGASDSGVAAEQWAGRIVQGSNLGSSRIRNAIDRHFADLRTLSEAGRIAFRSARQMDTGQMDARAEREDVFVCVAVPDADVETFLEYWGYIQDPDVLDTWFSSALWPHSTLGWPDETRGIADVVSDERVGDGAGNRHAVGGADGDDGDLQHGRDRRAKGECRVASSPAKGGLGIGCSVSSR